MDENELIRRLLAKLPFHKIDKYQVTNLSLDAIALVLTSKFTFTVLTVRPSEVPLMVFTWLYVITATFVCVFWASRK